MDTNSDTSPRPSPRSGEGEDLAGPQAAALASADEILMRCTPGYMGTEARFTAAGVIDRDKGDLVIVLSDLADALEGNSRVNIHTGFLETYVDPGWFGKFARALDRHTGRRVEL